MAEQNYCASCGAELGPFVGECVECGYEPDSGSSALSICFPLAAALDAYAQTK